MSNECVAQTEREIIELLSAVIPPEIKSGKASAKKQEQYKNMITQVLKNVLVGLLQELNMLNENPQKEVLQEALRDQIKVYLNALGDVQEHPFVNFMKIYGVER